jgi:hypothetical protein
MGKFGDGKLRENEVFLDEKTKALMEQVKDPKTLKEMEK